MSKPGPAVEAIPPVIGYAALPPEVPLNQTAVAQMLNAGSSAAEAAGVTEPVPDENGWNWGTVTAATLGLLLVAANILSGMFSPGWLNTLPPWLFYGYMFGLLPAVALAGTITARIRPARHKRWLIRAREVAAPHGDKLVFTGEADEDDPAYSSHLIERIQEARAVLLSRADDESASAVTTALISVAEFITHPAPEPLPPTVGMLDSTVKELRGLEAASAASAEAAHERMGTSLKALETRAGIKYGGRARSVRPALAAVGPGSRRSMGRFKAPQLCSGARSRPWPAPRCCPPPGPGEA